MKMRSTIAISRQAREIRKMMDLEIVIKGLATEKVRAIGETTAKYKTMEAMETMDNRIVEVMAGIVEVTVKRVEVMMEVMVEVMMEVMAGIAVDMVTIRKAMVGTDIKVEPTETVTRDMEIKKEDMEIMMKGTETTSVLVINTGTIVKVKIAMEGLGIVTHVMKAMEETAR